MAVQKAPFGRYHLQDLGLTRRVMKGEGEFVGPGAYEEFKRLASIFYLPGPGALVHPVWQAAEVYFVELSLRQEPRADYVSYTFTFWESSTQSGTEGTLVARPAGGTGGRVSRGESVHTVVHGETLWGIAQKYGQELSALIAMNPQIKNPNLVLPGERVRVG